MDGGKQLTLGSLAARGAVVTIGLQGMRFVVQFAGLVVLGRILAPSDFGFIAMVTAVIGIGDIVREFGLVPAAVQARTLTLEQRANLFWLCSGLGVVVAVLACAASPFIGWFYHESRLAEITLVLSLTFIFNGIQSQYQAGLAREMRFAALSITDLCAQAIGLGLAVTAALYGLGYWALVVQLVAQSVSLLVMRAIVSKWLPGWPNRTGNIRTQLRYGRSLVLTQSLVYVSSNIDSLLVGSRFGAAQLGFYNRGFQILMMPLNQILTPLTTVALPVLSRIADETVRFNNYLQRAQIVVAYPAVLLFSAMAAAAHPLIRVVFGEQWIPSAPIFQVLAIAGAFQAVGYVGYWVFLAKGLTASHLRFSLISRAVLILAILAGSSWGPIGIAAGYSIGTVLNWPLALLWLRREAKIRIGPLLSGGLRSTLLGLLCAAVATAVHRIAAPTGDISAIFIMVASSLSFAALAVLLVPRYRRDMVAIYATVKLVTAPKDSVLENSGEKLK